VGLVTTAYGSTCWVRDSSVFALCECRSYRHIHWIGLRLYDFDPSTNRMVNVETKAFLLVALPAARPGAVAAAILGFLVAWNDFFYALIITRSSTSTAPVAVMNFISYDSVAWGSIAVASIALTLPILVKG